MKNIVVAVAVVLLVLPQSSSFGQQSGPASGPASGPQRFGRSFPAFGEGYTGARGGGSASRSFAARPARFGLIFPECAGAFAPECPGYTKSRAARANVNRTVEYLLRRGVDDPLSHPAYVAATYAEDAVSQEVDACNRAWLRAHSIYRGTAIVCIGDDATQTLTSLLLTLLGFDAVKVPRPDGIMKEISAALAADRPVPIAVLDVRLTSPELRTEVYNKLRSTSPGGIVIPLYPRPGDPLIAQFRRFGFANLLPEPYDPVLLTDVLRHITGGAGRRLF
ncbi:MAG TPA: hypothetical protein VK463_15410 [Desulfomonilaceae bacterium]|nr:hypothetical protein [Desulfomonilaceae bacterium]